MINDLNRGLQGLNDPQLWLVGFDKSRIGDILEVAINGGSINSTLNRKIAAGDPDRFMAIEGKGFPKDLAHIVLFDNKLLPIPTTNGTYEVIIKDGSDEIKITVVIAL